MMVTYTKFCFKNIIILSSSVDQSTGEDGNDVCAAHTTAKSSLELSTVLQPQLHQNVVTEFMFLESILYNAHYTEVDPALF